MIIYFILERFDNIMKDFLKNKDTSNCQNRIINYFDDIVPTNINYTYSILTSNINSLASIYPFLEIFNIGYSYLNKSIPCIRFGNGTKKVFYSAAIHANEWITTPLLLKFAEEYASAYAQNGIINGEIASSLYDTYSLYLVPMVNPVERNHALLVVSLRVFRGSSLMDSGAHEDMKTSPPVMPFSSIGIWMVPQTMWELLSAPMAAVFIPWREIPAMPARSKVMT